MSLRLVLIVAAVAVVAVTLDLLRRRLVRERFAVLWVAISLMLSLAAAFPRVLSASAELLGFDSAADLVTAAMCGALLAICVHLSVAASRIEERTRRLAEELVLQQHEFSEFVRRSAATNPDERSARPAAREFDL